MKPRLCAILAVLIAAFAASGCLSTKYKLAPKAATAAESPALNLATPPASDLAVVVNTVIVYKGPGSWKREAYWDEYVLTLANPGSAPVTLESATLVDYQGQSVLAGDNPWLIEKTSKTWWQNVRSSEAGRLLKLGGVTVLTGATAVGIVVGSGGFLGPASSSAVAAANVFAAATLAIPIYAVGSIIRNVNGRHAIETEFHRRRLALPAAVASGQPVQGSLFFRISPGPRQLILRYRVGADVREAIVELAPLSGLHFKAPPKPK